MERVSKVIIVVVVVVQFRNMQHDLVVRQTEKTQRKTKVSVKGKQIRFHCYENLKTSRILCDLTSRWIIDCSNFKMQ